MKSGILVVIFCVLSVLNINAQDNTGDLDRSEKDEVGNLENDETEWFEELKSITVSASQYGQSADKRTLAFSEKELGVAFDSFELLKTLPGIRFDSESGRIKGKSGGDVQLLINGIATTENEVKLIPKNKIKKVEIYDIPPARYRNVENVINIVTGPLDDGLTVGFDFTNAFLTGFGNDNFYFTYNRGKNKLTIDYYLQYRNYSNRQQDSQYNYNLSGVDHSLAYHNKSSRWGYTTHSPRLKYSWVDDDKTVVEITAKAGCGNDFNKATGSGTYTVGAQEPQELETTNNSRENDWNPSLDAYFWKHLSPKDELSVNIVGTYFNVDEKGRNLETYVSDETPIYDDNRVLKNTKGSVIGEIASARKFSFANWNSGWQGDVSWLHSRADNEFGQFDYNSRFTDQYLYTELSGRYGNWLYRASLGLTYTDNKSNGVRVRNWHFTPKVVVGYNINEIHTFRLTYNRDTKAPNINDLSSNISNVSIDILQTGNPSLKNEVVQTVSLQYDFSNKYINFIIRGKYEHTKFPIVDYYEEDSGKFWYRRINGTSLQDWGGRLWVDVMPLGNKNLQFVAMVNPVRSSLRSEKIKYSLTSWDNSFAVVYDHKSFSLRWDYQIPTYIISGSWKSLTENHQIFMASYKIKDWKVSAGIWFIGQPSHYDSQTVTGSNVNIRRVTNIYNNRNMLTLGLSYHFQKGKTKSVSRNLYNSDTSAPTK